MAALPALLRRENENTAFRVYVTDCLKLIAENTAKSAMGGGSAMKARYYELVNTKKKKDTRTGAEIAADVIKKAGLKVVS